MHASEIKALKNLAEKCGVKLDGFDSPASLAETEDVTYAEVELTRMMTSRARLDGLAMRFLAAGASDYFLPAVVKEARAQAGEAPALNRHINGFLSQLTAMPDCTLIADDLVTSLARLLITITGQGKEAGPAAGNIMLSAGLSPQLRAALQTRLKYHAIDAGVMDFDPGTGCLSAQQLKHYTAQQVSVCVFAWPNFFGLLESLDLLVDWAQRNEVMLVGVVNPLLLAYLKSPAEICGGAVDHLVGDIQSLGLPVNRSGNAPSFIASRKGLPPIPFVAQSASPDLQDLARVMACIEGGKVAMNRGIRQARRRLLQLLEAIAEIPAVSMVFPNAPVNECVIRLDGVDMQKALKILSGHNMLCGYSLDDDYPQLQDCLLLHCHDRHTMEDVQKLALKLKTVVNNLGSAACPVKPKF